MMVQAGTPDTADTAALQTLYHLTSPAVEEAERRHPNPSGISVRIWASPLIVDVLHHNHGQQHLALRVYVTNQRVAEALADFINAGLGRLPSRDRLKAIAKTTRPGFVLAAELDLFGDATGVVLSRDGKSRLELFRHTEAPH